MKRIIAILLLSLASSAYALPDCPSDQNQRYHNCFGTYAANGDKYVGEWKADKQNGYGTATWNNAPNKGDKYVGEFKGGKKQGQGTYTFANGDKYVGEFKDGNLNGQGTYTFTDGRKYVGEWKADEKNGQGTYTFANGDKYVGEFKDGKYHGQGTATYANGTIQAGVWEMDTYLGTKAELDAKVEREEAENKYNRIYNACLLDKSSDVDMQVASLRRAVEETCEVIAADPSWYDEWKYN
jgi:hypothetical protein